MPISTKHALQNILSHRRPAALTVLVFGVNILFQGILRSAEVADILFEHTIVDASGMSAASCKALGDIDGDGSADICAASATDPLAGLSWYRYPDWEKFSVDQGTYTTEMRLADIDGDGDLDVVIPKGTEHASTICWYENPLPGLPATTDSWTLHEIGVEVAHDVSVGDIDNNGFLDVVGRNRYWTGVFFQAAGGVWTRKDISSREFEGLGLGDLDGDGDLDVVINGYWLQNPLPLSSPLTGTWIERTIDATWPIYAKVFVVDLNDNGRLDVVLSVTEHASARFSWYESTSPVTGPWVEHSIDATLSYLHSLAVADMDLDGYLDVITAEMHQSSDPDLVCVFLNQDNSLTWTREIVATTGSHNAVVGDIGGDGDIDIVGSNWESRSTNSDPIEYWENLLRSRPSTGDGGDLPRAFTLFPNFPNPFNSTTTIRYQLPGTSPGQSQEIEETLLSDVRLTVTDELGREVAVLVDGKQAPGLHEVRWDAGAMASGVYFYKLTFGNLVQTRRLILLR
jgi:hypothetical protein